MKILIAGFEGNDNSAKILLDNIKEECNIDVLYLENDFNISRTQIEEKLLQTYDYVLIFGQKPKTKDIYLENNAIIEGNDLKTDYYYGVLRENLESNNYKVISSNDAGKEHFLERVNSRNGTHTIDVAAELGVGTKEYELINLD